MSNLAVIENSSLQVLPKQEQLLKLIKETYAKGATNEEVEFFAQVCSTQNLDPIKRQIYFTKIWDSTQNKNVFSPMVSIDGMRSKAEETGLYAGQTIPLYCGKDGIWKEIWAEKDFPFACKVGVFRKDFKEPIYAVAYWDSYVKKTTKGEITKFWASMPTTMISKCAEALALRKACPQKLSGLYSKEEMDNVIDVEKSHETQTYVQKPVAQIQKVMESEKIFNAVNEFNNKKNEYSILITELIASLVGIYDIDEEFKSSFNFEFTQYLKDEFIKNNGNVNLDDLFIKKLTAKRLNVLAIRHNAGRDEKLSDAQVKDLKKQVYEAFMKDMSTNLIELFTTIANDYIAF